MQEFNGHDGAVNPIAPKQQRFKVPPSPDDESASADSPVVNNSTQIPASTTLLACDIKLTNADFVSSVFKDVSTGASAAICSKSGDPSDGGWFAIEVDNVVGGLPVSKNNYINCSSFYKDTDGSFKVRKDQFAACHFVMLDDLGTKVPMDQLGGFKLSWVIETSPGNYQGGIIFSTPITDGAIAERLLNALIDAGLCDKGASGPLTRWARLLGGINGKPKYIDALGKHFRCRLVQWNPEARYTPDEVATALHLYLAPIALIKDVSDPYATNAATGYQSESSTSFHSTPSAQNQANIKILLKYIDAGIPRPEWLRVLMAIHFEFSGSDEGFYLVNEWSSTGSNYKGIVDIEIAWASFKLGKENSCNIGTIINMVKAKGIDWMSVCAEAAEPFENCETIVVPSKGKSAPHSTSPKPRLAGGVGNNTTDNADVAAVADDSDDAQLAAAFAIAERLLVAAKTDCGAPLEPEAINALWLIRQHSSANYQRIRTALKKANRDVSISAVDAAIHAKSTEGSSAQTHHGYASNLIVALTVSNWRPVSHDGSLFMVDAADGLWIQRPIEKLANMVAEAHDGKEYCVRKSDYRNIAEHVITIVSDDKFFPDAPVGLACPGGFYRVINNGIVVEPLSPAHRQRVKVDFTPTEQDIPLFAAFLHETFQSSTPGEEEQQVVLVQEIAGATLLGLMPRYHKAGLLYDPFG